jgi:uncharacterized protein YndB with AHSA1/START domain
MCIVLMIDSKRIDRAERYIRASPEQIFGAFVDPLQLIKWLPPEGMRCKIHGFEATKGYVMSLYYHSTVPAGVGKTNRSEDRFEVIFDSLVPGVEIVQRVIFDTSDPSFSGEMRQTWTFKNQKHGTLICLACENVPQGVRPEDHAAGMNSSLENLARLVEAGN